MLRSSIGLLVICCWMSVSGCANHQTYSGPRIIETSDIVDPLASLPDPVQLSPQQIQPVGPQSWYPPKSLERRWQAIVIHHSATSYGNMAIFDQWHREGNHWEGVGYDFVIGNGTDSADGQVEVTFRWTQQMTGAHCKTPGNWANENAIGICLVGNFDVSVPTRAQMQSLEKLIQFLSARYHISPDRIYGHKTTPGARATDCPGNHLSLVPIRAMISK